MTFAGHELSFFTGIEPGVDVLHFGGYASLQWVLPDVSPTYPPSDVSSSLPGVVSLFTYSHVSRVTSLLYISE